MYEYGYFSLRSVFYFGAPDRRFLSSYAQVAPLIVPSPQFWRIPRSKDPQAATKSVESSALAT
jgi:hypothetical protein